MQCPACGRELVSKKVNGLLTDVCEGGCGGVWFSWSEVGRLKGAVSASQESLVVAQAEGISLDQSRRYRCPHCEDIVMSRDFLSLLPDLLLDECPSCGGFWLNGDEVEDISRHALPPSVTDKIEPKETRAHRIVHAVQVLFPSACGAEIA